MLAPGKAPASCEQCGQTDLLPKNRSTLEVLKRFPGLIRQNERGKPVDYQAVIWMAENYGNRYGIEDPADFLENLEAIRKGWNVNG